MSKRQMLSFFPVTKSNIPGKLWGHTFMIKHVGAKIKVEASLFTYHAEFQNASLSGTAPYVLLPGSSGLLDSYRIGI